MSTAAGQPTAPRRRKRILIVDDDPAIGRMLARLFERDHDVVIAGDGPSAIALASRAPAPDLALLDIMMPVMDGLTLALRFKAMPETRKMPVIFITAKGASTDVIRGIQAGARSYIVKPFRLEDVREKVHKALGA
ncbi:MAG TPA: response regulator [Polyangiaceae bacterium]|nr:response regulator [Polyangiaceae bacterium]